MRRPLRKTSDRIMIQTSSHKNGDVKQMNVKSCQNALTPSTTMRQTHGQVHCGSRHPTIMEDSTCPQMTHYRLLKMSQDQQFMLNLD